MCVHPEMVFTFPCHWNYRPDHCIYGSNCIPAEEGVVILHGNRGVFHSDKQPAFKAVYDAFKHVSYCIILEEFNTNGRMEVSKPFVEFQPMCLSKANESLFTFSGSTHLERIS